ncbi:MAG TPA: YdcF family protein [Candidatus Eubacterium avistercoris]|uniref:YdcF family protein n=1 Tax=Candidatus Eubacterium avistercoris TaxID=2838567 RepID=A0A9D2IGS3_9FIRM|nr:YdcF family protein [Candidatus Eubacterium avistercoris]
MKHKIGMIICVIAGIICGIYGIMVYSTGSGTGFFAVWIVIGVLLAALGVSFAFQLWKKLPKILVRVIVCLAVAGLTFFCVVEGRIASQLHAQGKAGLDYVIVLGAQVYESGPSMILRYRLDRAVRYLEENPDTVCIVSGGQGYNEPFPEAEGMAEYLISRGISAERIIKEDQSKNTEENIRNSMEYLDRSSSVGIITNNFHVFRAMQIAKDAGLEDAWGIASGSPPRYLPNNMLREFFAEIKYLGRAVL